MPSRPGCDPGRDLLAPAASDIARQRRELNNSKKPPSSQRKLGSTLILKMDPSLRWDDEAQAASD